MVQLHGRRCDICLYYGKITDADGVCANPVYKRGKRIYQETKGVIAHVGCVSCVPVDITKRG